MNKKKIIIGVACIALIIAGIFFFAGKLSNGKMYLDTVSASRHSMTNSVTATGKVEPVTKVDVGTQVSGIIDKIYVDFNSQVTKGQIIAEMDKVNLQADLVAKEADLASSKTEFEYQEKNYTRNKTLHDKQLISDTDFETATYNYERAKNSYTNNLSGMTKVRRNLQYAIITSPIDGVVINRAVEEGQTVAAGFSTPTLFTIANDLTQMQVIADVDEADIGQVEEGQKVTFTVDAYPNDVFEGKVTQVRLEATVTTNVVTYQVVISAHNPDLKLKPGLTASVTIFTLERNDVLTIPTKALRYIPDKTSLHAMNISVSNADAEIPQGKKMIWVKEGNTLNPKLITVGISSMNMTEIVDGITDKDVIVTDLTTEAPATSHGDSVRRNPLMPGPPRRR
ncbi:MAG: efflux RND transporter periplasmic adaptor subunit [Tannerella sp.]|jgi:HlyD family secretion protein|nr:efflux RND transporter periplasmic adaptor subunit [Tannerella sp.]